MTQDNYHHRDVSNKEPSRCALHRGSYFKLLLLSMSSVVNKTNSCHSRSYWSGIYYLFLLLTAPSTSPFNFVSILRIMRKILLLLVKLTKAETTNISQADMVKSVKVSSSFRR